MQTPLTHAMLLPQAWVAPHPPQLELSVMKSTHAPLQSVYDVSHANPQPASPPHVACECATEFAQVFPHPMQLFGSVAVFTQRPLHAVGVALGQLPTHANPASPVAHSGCSSLHWLPHAPQLPTEEGSSQPPSHMSHVAGHPASGAASASAASSPPPSSPGGTKVSAGFMSSPPAAGPGPVSPVVASHPALGQSWDEKPWSPEMDAHAPSPAVSTAAKTAASAADRTRL
jgi:hypothetical protein